MKSGRLLMLGGSDVQVPAIRKAQELGLYVITCGNRPQDIGHQYADESHTISSTSTVEVLELARRLRVDGISAYGSDPAAVTAAYVADEMGLPGGGLDAVTCLQDKVLFREAQHRLGIAAPRSAPAISASQVLKLIASWPHGCIIKPVDTSGSKGCYVISADEEPEKVQQMLDSARSFSRSGKVIVEEFLLRVLPQMTGDVLIVDGRIAFFCFGDVHFNSALNGLVPRSVSFPSVVPMAKQQEAMAGAQRLISDLGVKTGVFNIDVIVDDAGRAIMIDIGARNGGNMVGDLMHRRTGVDLTEASICQSMGWPVTLNALSEPTGYFAHAVVHSLHNGILRSIHFDDHLERAIFHRSIIAQPGDKVERFAGSSSRLGLLLLSFPTQADMLGTIADMYDHMVVEVDVDPPA